MTVTPDLDRRFRAAAAAEGLLDVGFDVIDSPIGPLLVAATDRGLLRVSFDGGGGDPEAALEQIAAALDSSPDAARQAASSGVRRLRRRIT